MHMHIMICIRTCALYINEHTVQVRVMRTGDVGNDASVPGLIAATRERRLHCRKSCPPGIVWGLKLRSLSHGTGLKEIFHRIVYGIDWDLYRLFFFFCFSGNIYIYIWLYIYILYVYIYIYMIHISHIIYVSWNNWARIPGLYREKWCSKPLGVSCSCF